MENALPKMNIRWGEFCIYLDEFGYAWFKESDLCQNLMLPRYDDLPRLVKDDYMDQPWCYEKEPCRCFEMKNINLMNEWFWYEDFVWWVAKSFGIVDFARFIEKQFEESLDKFCDKERIGD